MKRLLTLYKMLNKNNSASDTRNGNSKTVLYGMIGVVVAFGLGYVGYRFADYIDMLGGVAPILNISGIATSMVILGFGIFMLISNMYMSSDIELLITLPLSSFDIVMLRVLSFLRFAYGIGAVLIIPINIGFSVAKGEGFATWLGIILMLIMVPLFATAFTATLVILIMSVVKIFRNMDVLRYIGIAVVFLLICVYFYLSGNNSNNVDTMALFTQITSVGSVLKYVVPVSGFMIDFITEQNILSLLLAVAITAVAIGLCYVVGRALYLQGALNMQNTRIGGKILGDEELSKASIMKNPYKALVSKELRILRRNPVYSLHNFVIGFLWPILAIVLLNSLGSIIQSGIAMRNVSDGAAAVDLKITLVETAILIFLVLLLPMLNASIAYSSLSREGNSFPIMKQIPIAYETQIKAKITVAERIHHMSTTLYVAIISIVLNIIMGVPFYYFIIPTVISFIAVEICIYADMLIGYKKAFVNWDNEKTIAQKDSGGLILIDLALAFGLPGIMVAMALLGGQSLVFHLIPLLVMTILLAVIMVLLRKSTIKKGAKRIRTLRF